MYIETKPINFFYDRILKGFGFYVLLLVFFQSRYKDVNIGIKFIITLSILMVPFFQLILYRADDIYLLKCEDGVLSVKWKRFWKHKGLECSIDNVKVDIKPFLKRTYKMKVTIFEDGKNVDIIQLSNKTWTIDVMNKLKKIVHQEDSYKPR